MKKHPFPWESSLTFFNQTFNLFLQKPYMEIGSYLSCVKLVMFKLDANTRLEDTVFQKR